MSQWTYVNAIITIETGKTFKNEKQLKRFIYSIVNNAPQINGSEGPASRFVNVVDLYGQKRRKKYNVKWGSNTPIIITVSGGLRDRSEEQVSKELESFINFLNNSDYIIVTDNILVIKDAYKESSKFIENTKF